MHHLVEPYGPPEWGVVGGPAIGPHHPVFGPVQMIVDHKFCGQKRRGNP